MKTAPSSTSTSASSIQSGEDAAGNQLHSADSKTAPKRSAIEAGVSESEDCKRNKAFSQESYSKSAEAATVHIELQSDDENALYDV